MDRNIIAVIPAYEPPHAFIDYAKELVTGGVYKLVVVNDGSCSKYAEVFESLKQIDNVIVLEYPENHGKGYALKYAFSFIKENFDANSVIVTADCDGQHLVKDVLACSENSENYPQSLILGARDFSLPHVPARSRFGNVNTRRAFKLLYGLKLTDTQTGLRAFTYEMLDDMIAISGDRFEYEMNMLVVVHKSSYTIVEVPIETVYEQKPDDVETRSHFKTFRDSVKVWGVLFKNVKNYFLALLAAGVIEYSVFGLCEYVIFPHLHAALGTLYSTVIARVLSSILNCTLNYKLVFKGTSKTSIIKYYTLWLFLLGSSYGLTHLFGNVLGSGDAMIITKIIIDLCLSIISYQAQTHWVFPHKTTKSKKIITKQ